MHVLNTSVRRLWYILESFNCMLWMSKRRLEERVLVLEIHQSPSFTDTTFTDFSFLFSILDFKRHFYIHSRKALIVIKIVTHKKDLLVSWIRRQELWTLYAWEEGHTHILLCVCFFWRVGKIRSLRRLECLWKYTKKLED